MSQYIKHEQFIDLAIACQFDPTAMVEEIRRTHNPAATRKDVLRRLNRYKTRGYLPLPSGNSVSTGEVLRGTSTLFDDQNNVVLQWVKTDVPKEQQLESILSAISELTTTLPPALEVAPPTTELSQLTTLYISNDIHFGALMWAPESGTDWDLPIATTMAREAYDYLFSSTPSSHEAVVVDLGDLMEVDSFKNVTPNSGNPLAVDGRYPKILRASYEALAYAVEQALKKHQIVHFYNIAGNHDVTSGLAIREIIRAIFANNPRVIVHDSPAAIQYHQFGQVLFQFAHGDGLKMKDAGEVMAADCESIFSNTRFRYAHFGHNHKDSVIDGRICRSESHRNLPPVNDWAAHKGYRRQLGTMKAITYHADKGEIARNLFTVT